MRSGPSATISDGALRPRVGEPGVGEQVEAGEAERPEPEELAAAAGEPQRVAPLDGGEDREQERAGERVADRRQRERVDPVERRLADDELAAPRDGGERGETRPGCCPAAHAQRRTTAAADCSAGPRGQLRPLARLRCQSRGWAPTCSRIVSSRTNEERTCSRASARAPAALRADERLLDRAVLLGVLDVQPVDRVVARRPHGRPGERPARALRELLDERQVGDAVDHVVERVVRAHPVAHDRAPPLARLARAQLLRDLREPLLARVELGEVVVA